MTIDLPQFSLCETRTSPATSCAYYQLAPPAPDKNKKKKPPRPSPEELAQQAMDRAMALAMQPKLTLAPSGVGLTGLDTYVWLADEPQPITARAVVPGLAVTAEARPVEYTWTFGDGATKVTTHSGRRWTRRRAGNVAHLYEQRGTYDLEIAVRWEARWRIGAGAWRPLGTFTNSDSTTYPVRQIVAVLVRAN